MVQPTQAGEILAGFDDEFAEWFERDVTVTNFISGDDAGVPEDDYRDVNADDRKPVHPASPTETTAQVDKAGSSGSTSNTETAAYGIEEKVDAEIHIDDGILITNGGDKDSQGRSLPYPSEIEAGDRTFVVVDVFDQGNGTQLALAQSDD